MAASPALTRFTIVQARLMDAVIPREVRLACVRVLIGQRRPSIGISRGPAVLTGIAFAALLVLPASGPTMHAPPATRTQASTEFVRGAYGKDGSGLGFDVYPCKRSSATCDFGAIDAAINAIEGAGITRYWAIVQDFQDCYYRLPTPQELRRQFDHWAKSNMAGYFVFSWNYQPADPKCVGKLGQLPGQPRRAEIPELSDVRRIVNDGGPTVLAQTRGRLNECSFRCASGCAHFRIGADLHRRHHIAL